MQKHGGFLFVLGFAWILALGCGERAGGESIGSHADSLAVVLSAELDLEKYPALTQTTAGIPAVACGSDQCLVVYAQTLFGTRYLFATRIAMAGPGLDGTGVNPWALDRVRGDRPPPERAGR